MGGNEIGENDESDVRRTRMNCTQHVEPGAADQLKVEHDAVGLRVQDAPDGVLRALRFADDLRAFDILNELDEIPADLGRVLGDKHRRSCALFHAGSLHGNDALAHRAASENCRRTRLNRTIGFVLPRSQSSWP